MRAARTTPRLFRLAAPATAALVLALTASGLWERSAGAGRLERVHALHAVPPSGGGDAVGGPHLPTAILACVACHGEALDDRRSSGDDRSRLAQQDERDDRRFNEPVLWPRRGAIPHAEIHASRGSGAAPPAREWDPLVVQATRSAGWELPLPPGDTDGCRLTSARSCPIGG